MTGPIGYKIIPEQFTPDMRTMFVKIQPPGEAPLPHPGRNEPTRSKAISSWPKGDKGGHARPATITVRRAEEVSPGLDMDSTAARRTPPRRG
jgi:secreted PhoX family phosphatase